MQCFGQSTTSYNKMIQLALMIPVLCFLGQICNPNGPGPCV